MDQATGPRTAGAARTPTPARPKPARLPGSPASPPVTDALIAAMVSVLVEEADPERVILFGSRGRGDARDDSDVDLIVVEADLSAPDGAG